MTKEICSFSLKSRIIVFKSKFGTSVAHLQRLPRVSFLTSAWKGEQDVNLKTSRVEAIVIGGSIEGKLAQYPKRRSDLNYRTIEGETIILNREEGQLHQLNPSASFIWDCCDGNSNIAEIIDRLAGAYEVEPSTARKDVEEVLLKLRKSNLLEAN